MPGTALGVRRSERPAVLADARMTARATFRSWVTWSGTFAIFWHTASA